MSEERARPAPLLSMESVRSLWLDAQDQARALARVWPFWLALSIALVAASAGLETGIERLGHRWEFAYKHGYLILAMSAWLLMAGRHTASISRIGPSLIGFGLLVAGVLAYLLAEILDITLGLQFMLPALLFALVTALGGLQVAGFVMLPIGLVYFAIPVWDLLVTPLQEASTWAVTGALSLGNIPVHVDGHLVHIAAGTFEIAEGCSGQRYFLVALTLASFYGLAWYRRWSTRLLLVLAAVSMSMLGNWVRIYLLVLIGEWTDMQHPVIESHGNFGWVIFAILMAPVLWFARWLELREPAVGVRSAISGVAADSMASVPVFLAGGIAAALIVASPLALRGGEEAPQLARGMKLNGFADESWVGVGPALDWQPAYVRPHARLHEGFVGADEIQVDVFIAYYGSQQADSKLIWHRHSLSEGWHQAARRNEVITVVETPRRIQELELVSRGERRLVWRWYSVGGELTHERTRAKLLEIPALLRGRRDGAVVAVSALCEMGCDETRESLQAFLESFVKYLDEVASSGGVPAHS